MSISVIEDCWELKGILGLHNPLTLKGEETNAPEKPQFRQLLISGGIVGKPPEWQLKFDSFRKHDNCEDKINKTNRTVSGI